MRAVDDLDLLLLLLLASVVPLVRLCKWRDGVLCGSSQLLRFIGPNATIFCDCLLRGGLYHESPLKYTQHSRHSTYVGPLDTMMDSPRPRDEDLGGALEGNVALVDMLLPHTMLHTPLLHQQILPHRTTVLFEIG